jgi:AcrR family transcriptional regulator
MARPSTITNEQILEAAREVFLERGFRATTAQVAKRARVAEGSLFNRFATKHELFFTAMQPAFQDPPFLRAIEGRVGHGDVRENMVDLGTQLLEFLRRILPLVMMSWSNRRGELPPHLASSDPPPVRALRRTTEYLRGEMKRGRLRRQDPEVLARALFGGVQNYVFHELIRKGRHGGKKAKAPQAYVRDLVALLWAGAAPVRRKAEGGKR